MEDSREEITVKKVELPQQSVIISLVLVFVVLGIGTIFYLAGSTNSQKALSTPTPDPNALSKFEQTQGLSNIVQPQSPRRPQQTAPSYGPTKPTPIPSSSVTPPPTTPSPIPSPSSSPTPESTSTSEPTPTPEPTPTVTPNPITSPTP